MMKKILSFLLLFCILASAGTVPCAALTPSGSPRSARPTGEQPIDPWTYQTLLGKGMDVDWCKTTEGMQTYSRQTAADFAAAGISHVRIRVKDPISTQLLDLLEQQVNDCLSVGLIPVIAYQADEMKNDPSDQNLEKVVAWWQAVASRFQDTSFLLSFDLMIEVTDALNHQPERLNEIYETLVSVIRQTNPERILMISPRLRSDPMYLADLKIPSQANGYLMAEWHFYAAGPSKTNPRKLWTTGTDAEKRLILNKIDLAKRWQAEQNIPTWVGAWMPGNYNDGNDYTIEEQVIFSRFLSDALTQAGIPFAVNADSHFYDRTGKHWIEEMKPVFTAIFSSSASNCFADVSPDSWYAEAVDYVSSQGIMTGTGSDTFLPEGQATRGMILTILYRMEHPNTAAGDKTDIQRAADWAVQNQLMTGYSAQTLGLSDPITREQLITLLYQYAGLRGIDRNTSFDLSRFQDADTISPYAIIPMQWACTVSLLTGTSNSSLSPSAHTTRAETAQLLMRFCEKYFE